MKKILFCFFPFLFLTACGQNVTEEDFLIGGTWVATAGYQDGEAEEESNCYPFQDGIEFIDKDTVFIETYGRDFEYQLSENKEGPKIIFHDSGPGGESTTSHHSSTTFHRYQINMITEDEIAFEGQSLAEGNTCYLERN
ncbi:MAG TPA: hypothetical protein VK072_07265 [Candidatus Avamphibacillus sp.]|nr:hypothetical protein [Candidatus Avamphibacillus sp.]